MKIFTAGITALAAMTAVLIPTNPVFAYDWVVTANVAVVEGSYAPTSVPFTIDVAAGSCVAGQFLIWTAQGSDNSARIASNHSVLALLLTARAAGLKVQVYGNNAGCAVTNIWLK